MTETPIDRLARAAWGKTPTCDLQRVSKGPCSLDDECCCWRVAKDNIRAILREMREPGAGAAAAGTSEVAAMDRRYEQPDTVFLKAWQDAINHILAEGAQ